MNQTYNIQIGMIVNKLTSRLLIQTRIMMKFSGGHHHQVYDWRDDHAQNPDFFEDPRMIGVRKAETFVTPYKEEQSERLTYRYSHPSNYNPKDLTTNMVGSTHFGVIQNNPEVPQSNYMADVAHEFDYESEDLDFQPESFESQHFRKQGQLWMWVLAGLCPLWFFANQLFVQFWPDADNWRYQRPPPFNYPNPQDSKDGEYLEMFKSRPHQQLYDAGIVNAPFFQIINGKKVYTKWSGVNQPREAL